MTEPRRSPPSPGTEPGPIRLSTLGETGAWSADGSLLGSVLEKPKVFGLLAYLACHPDRDLHQRESLTAVFWPEADARRAGNCLRQAIHVLRSCLPGDPLLSRRRSLVGVRFDRLDVDVRRFREAVASGQLEAAATLYRGDFLEGFAVQGAAEVNRWIDAQQRQLRQTAVDVVRSLARRATHGEGHRATLRWWSRALELAPYDESAASGVILALSGLGRRGEALDACDRFVRRRLSELGLPPSPGFKSRVEQAIGDAAAMVAWGGSASAKHLEPAPDVPVLHGPGRQRTGSDSHAGVA